MAARAAVNPQELAQSALYGRARAVKTAGGRAGRVSVGPSGSSQRAERIEAETPPEQLVAADLGVGPVVKVVLSGSDEHKRDDEEQQMPPRDLSARDP
ncbi:MAG: hypothetical protein H0X42_06600 [Solirubrobacterales bacterium]|nr:hypothetical protein [Solirubrobacterales bacterium]